MKRLLIAVCVLVLTPPASRTAWAQAAPGGSYLQSCINIGFDTATNTLTAHCAYQPNDLPHPGGPIVTGVLGITPGTTYQTSLITTNCAQGADIENIRGALQCQADPTIYGYGGAVPNGSYQHSCMWWSVTGSTLNAACWDFSHGKINYGNNPSLSETQGWTNLPAGWVTYAGLDLTTCDMTADIENIRGQLICTPRPPGEALLRIVNGPPAAAPMNSAPQPSAASTATAGQLNRQVNVNLPNGDMLRPNGQRAAGTCRQGYVWRQANPEDHVCVTPQQRQQAASDNALAPGRTAKGSQAPARCLPGYVWRQANAQDFACVPPQTRALVAEENREGPQFINP